MLGLTISAIYNNGIGPRVDEKVPLMTITAIAIIEDDRLSSIKKLIPATNKQVEMIPAPIRSKMTLPNLLIRNRPKKTQQSPMEWIMIA